MSEGASPSGRAAPDHGPTILDGVIRRTSVSQLQQADESTNEGCLRLWFYERKLGLKEPGTSAQERGTRNHASVEHYLRTGEKRLPAVIVKNMHMVPAPGPDLLIEHPTVPAMTDGSSGLAHTPLRVAGVPVVGYIDLLHARPINFGPSDGPLVYDEPGTIEVRDWKFPSSLDYALAPTALPRSIQMAGYGQFVFAIAPNHERVRLSHGYMPERGRGDLRTILTDRATIDRTWEHAASVMRSMQDAARQTDPEHVPGNRKACRRFGKKCMHAAGGYCSVGAFSSLRAIVGATAHQTLTDNEESIDMGLNILDRIRAPQPAAAAAVATLSLQTQAVDPAEVARLQAEESLMREALQFETICDKVTAHGMGFPSLVGRAATLYAKAKGRAPEPSGQLGGKLPTGEFAIVIPDGDTMNKVLGELDQVAATRAATPTVPPADAPPAILSPETPVVPVTQAAAQTPTLPSSSVAATAQLATSVVQATALASETVFAEATAEIKKRRGRPPKNAATAAQSTEPKPPVETDEDIDQDPAPAPLVLFVNVLLDGHKAQSLHSVIDQVAAELTEKFTPGLDLRFAPGEGPLGFGRWRGAFAGRFREVTSGLDGSYWVDTRGSELAEIAVEAIRSRVRTSGGYIVRGV